MVPLPIVKDYVYLTCHTNNSPFMKKIIMAPITQEIEYKIDDGCNINLKLGNHSFYITKDKILTYGDIDVESDDDLDLIDHINFNIDPFAGFAIPADYDFETHSVKMTRSGIRYYQTWDVEKVFKYKYAELGKPDKIIIFKK